MGAEVGSRVAATSHRIERIAVLDVASRPDNAAITSSPEVCMEKTVVMTKFMRRHFKTERTVRGRAAYANTSNASIWEALIVTHCKKIQIEVVRIKSGCPSSVFSVLKQIIRVIKVKGLDLGHSHDRCNGSRHRSFIVRVADIERAHLVINQILRPCDCEWLIGEINRFAWLIRKINPNDEHRLR